jgi:tRNA-dihydrouridine synthase 3
MNATERQDFFRDRVFLAPLTKGGNLPFRRLTVELGARATCGEMAFAHNVVKGHRGEAALLRRAPEEECFGVQLAGRKPEQLARATAIAFEKGADFVDLNLGCPIDLLCKRGIGAALMDRPKKVGEIVTAMRAVTDRPLSVKMRLGYRDDRPRFLEVAEEAVAAGADALVLHGRSRTQRYKRASDWDAVAALVEQSPVPVVGNGDLLTWRDVVRQREHTGCASVMLGRGALIKPWVFREIAEGRDHLLDVAQRSDLLRRYRDLALAHFYSDERGRARVRDFLIFHLDFLCRYRPVPSEEFAPDAHPLIQERQQPIESDDLFERALMGPDKDDHAALADALIAEIDATPDGVGGWSERSASVILDGP